jgi:hypothetical protein
LGCDLPLWPGTPSAHKSTGAPEEIQTPDPQIRSLVRTVEIVAVRYRKRLIGRGARAKQRNSKAP